MVRDASTFFARQLGRTDVHAAVLLHRVDVDDLAAETLREVEREVGLSRRRGADDGDRCHRRTHCALSGVQDATR